MKTVNYVAVPEVLGEPTPHLPKSDPNFVPMKSRTESEVGVQYVTAGSVEELTGDSGVGHTPLVCGGPAVSFIPPRQPMVVILNGPPSVGKDTLVSELSKTVGYSVKNCSFKEPMFEIALSASGVTKVEWDTRYSDRDLKETPWSKLGSLSCREFMIRISEEWIKPMFGQEHFAKLAFNQVCNADVCIFSDGGFQEEFFSILSEFGRRNVKLVRLHREGCSFDNDSRAYLPDTVDFKGYDLYLEEGDIESGLDELKRMIGY